MELDVTWTRATKIWWSIFWRNMIAIVVSMILGAIIGAIIGFVLGIAGADITLIKAVCTPIGFIIGVLITIVPVKMILNKNYGDFRLSLIEISHD